MDPAAPIPVDSRRLASFHGLGSQGRVPIEVIADAVRRATARLSPARVLHILLLASRRMAGAWWQRQRFVMLGAYVGVVFATVPFTRRIVLALRTTDLLSATVTSLYAVAVAGVVYYVLFNRRLSDWIAFAVVSALLCVVTVLLLGLSIPEERVHFLQYGTMALLARYAFAYPPGRVGSGTTLALALLLTAALGLLDECLQGLVPSRVFDWRDVGMNAGAAVMALLLDELLHDRLQLRRAVPKGSQP
jgi:hypothetical protein